jgi:cyclohexanone monooxygenase
VAAYIRERIFDQVRDRSVAEVLGPRGYTLGARRVLVETTYFEAFNQPNVTLVDVRADPIQRVTGTGLETARSRYDLDMIIYATGFDSGTGAALRIDIRGRGGERLSEHWADGPRTYLGIMVSGFPDMFFIAGPGSPSIRSNVLVSIEQHVDWIGDFLAHLREHAVIAAEPSPEAEARWTAYVDSLVDKSLLAGDDTQYFGSNVPGKPRAYLAYIGGVGNYRKICNDVRDSGYEGMVLTSSGADGPSDLTASREWSGPHLDGSMRSRFGSTVI